MFAWLLLGLIIALTSMAWASPIDPSWIKGIYDDGDFDDVLSHLTSGTSAIPALMAADCRPPLGCVRLEVLTENTLDPSSLFSPHPPRAPPAA